MKRKNEDELKKPEAEAKRAKAVPPTPFKESKEFQDISSWGSKQTSEEYGVWDDNIKEILKRCQQSYPDLLDRPEFKEIIKEAIAAGKYRLLSALIKYFQGHSEECIIECLKLFSLSDHQRHGLLLEMTGLSPDHNYEALLKYLLNLGKIDLDDEIFRFSPLANAVKSNHFSSVKILLEHKADPTAFDGRVVHIALENSSEIMVRQLLSIPASQKLNNLFDAQYQNRDWFNEMVGRIINNLDDSDSISALINLMRWSDFPEQYFYTKYKNDDTLLTHASELGDPRLLTELLERKHDDLNDCKAHGGSLPLIAAIRGDQVSNVRILLGKKANPWASDSKGISAVFIMLNHYSTRTTWPVWETVQPQELDIPGLVLSHLNIPTPAALRESPQFKAMVQDVIDFCATTALVNLMRWGVCSADYLVRYTRYSSLILYASSLSDDSLLSYLLSLSPTNLNDPAAHGGQLPLMIAVHCLKWQNVRILIDGGAAPLRNIGDNTNAVLLALTKLQDYSKESNEEYCMRFILWLLIRKQNSTAWPKYTDFPEINALIQQALTHHFDVALLSLIRYCGCPVTYILDQLKSLNNQFSRYPLIVYASTAGDSKGQLFTYLLEDKEQKLNLNAVLVGALTCGGTAEALSVLLRNGASFRDALLRVEWEKSPIKFSKEMTQVLAPEFTKMIPLPQSHSLLEFRKMTPVLNESTMLDEYQEMDSCVEQAACAYAYYVLAMNGFKTSLDPLLDQSLFDNSLAYLCKAQLLFGNMQQYLNKLAPDSAAYFKISTYLQRCTAVQQKQYKGLLGILAEDQQVLPLKILILLWHFSCHSDFWDENSEAELPDSIYSDKIWENTGLTSSPTEIYMQNIWQDVVNTLNIITLNCGRHLMTNDLLLKTSTHLNQYANAPISIVQNQLWLNILEIRCAEFWKQVVEKKNIKKMSSIISETGILESTILTILKKVYHSDWFKQMSVPVESDALCYRQHLCHLLDGIQKLQRFARENAKNLFFADFERIIEVIICNYFAKKALMQQLVRNAMISWVAKTAKVSRTEVALSPIEEKLLANLVEMLVWHYRYVPIGNNFEKHFGEHLELTLSDCQWGPAPSSAGKPTEKQSTLVLLHESKKVGGRGTATQSYKNLLFGERGGALNNICLFARFVKEQGVFTAVARTVVPGGELKGVSCSSARFKFLSAPIHSFVSAKADMQWSDFCTTVGIKEDEWLDYALSNKGDILFRQLLAPQILDWCTNTSGPDRLPQGEFKTLCSEVKSLRQNVRAMSTEILSNYYNGKFRPLASQEEELGELKIFAEQKDGPYSHHPQICSQILSALKQIESGKAQLRELLLRESTYENFIECAPQIFAIPTAGQGQPDEKDILKSNTSMMSIIAKQLNATIVVHQRRKPGKPGNPLDKIYRTGEAQTEINIQLNFSSHRFIALLPRDSVVQSPSHETEQKGSSMDCS